MQHQSMLDRPPLSTRSGASSQMPQDRNPNDDAYDPYGDDDEFFQDNQLGAAAGQMNPPGGGHGASVVQGKRDPYDDVGTGYDPHAAWGDDTTTDPVTGGAGKGRPRKPKFSLKQPFAPVAESKAQERRKAGPAPFTPQINERSQKLAAASRGKGRVEDRFEKLDKQRKDRIEAKRREKLESELSAMSPPKMNKKSQAMTQRLGSHHNVEDRLMDYQRQTKDNLKKAREEGHRREEADLTFHPKITKSAQQMERGPAVWEQWYKDKYKRLKELERAVRSQDMQDMREPQISKGTAKLAAKRPDADKKVYERLYAYQDKYRDNRENLVREEEQRFSQTSMRSQSASYDRSRRNAERRRAAAYEDDGYTETPSQLFSTVSATTADRQPFTPNVNAHSTQIVRAKQERALQMVDGPDSHRSMGSRATPRVYGAEVAPRTMDSRHEKSKSEWNSMVNSFKQDFEQ